jgi:invasion protein IalB
MVRDSANAHDDGRPRRKDPIVRTRTTVAAALATAVAFVAPAAFEASAAETQSAAANCWATPGNAYPWNVTCLAGPYRYKSQCIVMQSGLVRQGHLVRKCRWIVWGSKAGYGSFYSGHTI